MIKLEKQLTILGYREIPQWDAFVESHSQGTIFHTTSMIRCKENTKRHYPFAYGVVDSSNNLCAILVAVRVSTLGGIPGQLSSRSIMYSQPIYVDTSVGHAGVRLLIKLHDEYMRKKTLFAEVRPFHDLSGENNPLVDSGFRRLGYLNYELSIDIPEPELFKAIGSKCRNNVRSAHRKGVIVTEVDPASSIDLVYLLCSESHAHSKIPMVDQTLFQSAITFISQSRFRIMVAKQAGVPIAAGCFLMFKNRVLCWYAGTKRISGVPATSCIFWEAIRQFSQEGYQVFDFAGGGWQGEDYGPGRFKAKFGGEQTNFGRYRKVYSPWKMKAAGSVYEKVREFIAPRANRLSH